MCVETALSCGDRTLALMRRSWILCRLLGDIDSEQHQMDNIV